MSRPISQKRPPGTSINPSMSLSRYLQPSKPSGKASKPRVTPVSQKTKPITKYKSELSKTPVNLSKRKAESKNASPALLHSVQAGRIEKAYQKGKQQDSGNAGAVCDSPVVSNTSWPCDSVETFAWGVTSFTDEDGNIIKTKPLKEPLEPANLNIKISAIRTEEFKIIALMANDIKNVFPTENDEYWDYVMKCFRDFEKAARHTSNSSKANFEYYCSQLYIVKGLYPTLRKSILGYRNLYRQLGAQRMKDQIFMEVQTKMWGLTYYLGGIQRLWEIFLDRCDDLRRFSLVLSRTNQDLPQNAITEIFKMSVLTHTITEELKQMATEITQLKTFMTDMKASPDEEVKAKMLNIIERKLTRSKTSMYTFDSYTIKRRCDTPQIVVAPAQVMTLPT
ncbi:hypothetical protein TWF730_008452 [Orbilia blumenaviensis]|uniref:Uncharacterized protein n=1 Tax=Orbilia blumenaviensis TaxID=1796055 RepID=A0AAV9V520_9PEZI